MNGLLNVSARVTKAKDKPWPHLKRKLIKKLTKPSGICDGNGIMLKAHLSK
jgi:hypothetical protein